MKTPPQHTDAHSTEEAEKKTYVEPQLERHDTLPEVTGGSFVF